MVDIHLYGKLRRLAPDSQPSHESVVKVAPAAGETVESLLVRLGVAPSDVYHIFLNGKLLSTRCTMAPWLVYPQVRSDPSDWNLSVSVVDGDRVGLFGPDMAALVV